MPCPACSLIVFAFADAYAGRLWQAGRLLQELAGRQADWQQADTQDCGFEYYYYYYYDYDPRSLDPLLPCSALLS